MSQAKNNKAPKDRDSSTKNARGSKSLHSEYDNSTEDGFKPNSGKKEKKN